MHGYLSADVVCSEERTVFPRTNHELNYEILETYNGEGQIYGHIFAQVFMQREKCLRT